MAQFRERGISLPGQRILTAANSAVLLAELGELVKSTVRHSPGLKVRDRITNAARVLTLPRGRVEDWWYGEVRRVDAFEAEQIRRYATAARYKEIARLERRVEALRAELARAPSAAALSRQTGADRAVRPLAAPRRPHRDGGRQRGLAPA